MTASDAWVALQGTRLSPPPGAHAAGAIDPNTPIELSLILRPRHALDDLEARLSQPGAAPLSREAYAARYAADAVYLRKVEAFAARHRLRVVEADAARRTVRVAGKAADIAGAFGVHLVRYAAGDGSTFRGYTGLIQVPADLAGIVQGVFGLDDRPVARPLR